MKITKFKQRTNLEKEIDNLLARMEVCSKIEDEYTTMAENLERLYKAKGCETPNRISPDTMAIIAGNLFGILLIMNYEKAGIITTKAISFVLKGRV